MEPLSYRQRRLGARTVCIVCGYRRPGSHDCDAVRNSHHAACDKPALTWRPATSRPTTACCSRYARSPSSTITAIPVLPTTATWTRWPRLPSHPPLRLQSDNPELIDASKALFDYPYSDNTPEHLKWLVAKKAEMRQTYPGYQYFDRILDKLNVQTMMANRVAMPNYLDPKRFHWVFFVDSFLFPAGQ